MKGVSIFFLLLIVTSLVLAEAKKPKNEGKESLKSENNQQKGGKQQKWAKNQQGKTGKSKQEQVKPEKSPKNQQKKVKAQQKTVTDSKVSAEAKRTQDLTNQKGQDWKQQKKQEKNQNTKQTEQKPTKQAEVKVEGKTLQVLEKQLADLQNQRLLELQKLQQVKLKEGQTKVKDEKKVASKELSNKLKDRQFYKNDRINTIKDQIAALEAQLDNQVVIEKNRVFSATFYGNLIQTAGNATDWKNQWKAKKQNKTLDANGAEVIPQTEVIKRQMKNNTKLFQLAAAKYQEISATQNMTNADGTAQDLMFEVYMIDQNDQAFKISASYRHLTASIKVFGVEEAVLTPEEVTAIKTPVIAQA